MNQPTTQPAAPRTRLDGKVAIVTGGSRGIGREHCLNLARCGATVVIADLADSPATDLEKEIRDAGGTAVAAVCDVTDWNACSELISRTVDEVGRLDVVVNNAGLVRDKMITSLTEPDWDLVIAVHLKGTFALTRHACEHWRAEAKAGRPQPGRIINTVSGTGFWGNPGQAAYGAAKAGIANLTLTTALEMARYDVTANAVSPIAATRMTAGMFDGDTSKHPDRSSPVVAWLASADSAWLTGAVLRVDGGRLIRMDGWTQHAGTYLAQQGAKLDVDEIGRAARLLWGTAPAGLGGGLTG